MADPMCFDYARLYYFHVAGFEKFLVVMSAFRVMRRIGHGIDQNTLTCFQTNVTVSEVLLDVSKHLHIIEPRSQYQQSICHMTVVTLTTE